ncbi:MULTISPECIES: DUF1850 domain-containing protein [unclassified Nocardiopsis]|uniref:DUF1850 domain-containing protein n=1 Tax=unclassified Nocardiopsis TaxID=2649073 RepID=UPI00066BD8C1|nr:MULTISPECIES: DUF1850 domain-containing protein [unclassified Nocardiopsis]MBQ1081275.1 DUF1850 domain-containing protein [Nocardiopsis sp. B62]
MEPTAVGPSADAEPRRPRISALRRAALWVGAGLGAALVVGALVPVWPALRLSVDGDRLGHLPLAEGEQFTVSYVHSIDHLPIEENLEVRDGELVADSTRLRQFGAGMGQIPGQGTGRADGEWWVIEDMNRHVGPELAIRVGTASVDHRLRTPDAEVRLSPCLTSRRVAVEPARISTLVLLVGRSPQPVCDE